MQNASEGLLAFAMVASCVVCSAIVYLVATKKRKILMIDFECFAPPNK